MNASPVTTEITVAGMTCSHCSTAVTSEPLELPGVSEVSIDLHPGADSAVTITSESALEPSAIEAAVLEAGYTTR